MISTKSGARRPAIALNRGILENSYYALVEQRVDGPEPDVIAVETFGAADIPAPTTAVDEKPTATLMPGN